MVVLELRKPVRTDGKWWIHVLAGAASVFHRSIPAQGEYFFAGQNASDLSVDHAVERRSEHLALHGGGFFADYQPMLVLRTLSLAVQSFFLEFDDFLLVAGQIFAAIPSNADDVFHAKPHFFVLIAKKDVTAESHILFENKIRTGFNPWRFTLHKPIAMAWTIKQPVAKADFNYLLLIQPRQIACA